MANLTTKDILDRVQARITDQSSAMRAKLLSWLNEIMQDVSNQPRNWQFLNKTSASLPITGNGITLPADFGMVIGITLDSGYFLTPDEAVTAEEAYTLLKSGGSDVLGYQVVSGNIIFYPSAIGNAILGYTAIIPDYADNASATVFPPEFRNLLIAGTLMMFYENDRDDNYGSQVQLYQMEMKKMKTMDNKKTPIPKINSNGYIRERV